MPFDHLIAVNKLQSQIGHSVTPKEATWFIILVIAGFVVWVVKRIVF